ncbi:heavy metal translocating P-type ATPase [candidate division KSB1 bacterium]
MIEFQSLKPAKDTTLSRIIRLVEEAQSRRAASEQWVEKFARVYTPAMLGLALFVATLPPLLFAGSWSAWFYQALVLLVIGCPCALVISTPVSIVAALTSAARNGVLIKGGSILEVPAKLKAIAFDKTGTLTHGKPEVLEIKPVDMHSPEDILKCAAALESHSTHPLAHAVLERAESDNIAFSPAEEFTIRQGRGAEGKINGKRYWIGSHRFLHEKVDDHPDFHRNAEMLESRGHTVVTLGTDDHVCGLISISDKIRDDAGTVVSELKNCGLERVVMLTGDNDGTARYVAEMTGTDEYKAELLPEDKADAVNQLVREYGAVAMVGDGINDAPALASSTLGIAMGAAGTDIAIETADIALMSDNLSRLPWLIRHSRRTLNIIKQNIFFALGVKAVFIVLASMGMATLWMAIAADMGASLAVIFNALRLLNGKSHASRHGKS